MRVCFQPDESLLPAQTRIDRLRAAVPQELPPPETFVQPTPEEDAAEADISEEEADVVLQPAAAAAVEAEAAPDDFTKDADHVPGETAAEGRTAPPPAHAGAGVADGARMVCRRRPPPRCPRTPSSRTSPTSRSPRR